MEIKYGNRFKYQQPLFPVFSIVATLFQKNKGVPDMEHPLVVL